MAKGGGGMEKQMGITKSGGPAGGAEVVEWEGCKQLLWMKPKHRPCLLVLAAPQGRSWL